MNHVNRKLVYAILATLLQLVVIGSWLLEAQINKRFTKSLLANRELDVPLLAKFENKATKLVNEQGSEAILEHINTFVDAASKIADKETNALKNHLDSQGNPIAVGCSVIVVCIVWISYFSPLRRNPA